ncbi:MAG: hypothetical protein BGN96_06565 [Bacteroidales bacterium 45-6]|nr:MAG: hypothetical protein BGN96_06565 [Bacteroidales bacterium 45-6]
MREHCLWAAAEYYDKSIEKSIECDFPHFAAIANELAAKFYLYCKRTQLAKFYMHKAVHYYKSYGATNKVVQLETRYSVLLRFQQSTHKNGAQEYENTGQNKEEKTQSFTTNTFVNVSLCEAPLAPIR